MGHTEQTVQVQSEPRLSICARLVQQVLLFSVPLAHDYEDHSLQADFQPTCQTILLFRFDLLPYFDLCPHKAPVVLSRTEQINAPASTRAFPLSSDRSNRRFAVAACGLLFVPIPSWYPHLYRRPDVSHLHSWLSAGIPSHQMPLLFPPNPDQGSPNSSIRQLHCSKSSRGNEYHENGSGVIERKDPAHVRLRQISQSADLIVFHLQIKTTKRIATSRQAFIQ